ncbi:MAG: HDOD domain-containing protein [bacterium]|nr:HDOD domain-containing protein [bacterium]
MSEEEVFGQLKHSNRVPSLPQVLQEVVRASGDSDLSSKELAKIIKKDLSLTAQLLKLVNSPRYHRSGRISSIDYAVTQVGTRAAIAMALSTGIYRAFNGTGGSINPLQFWHHSLETAVAGREIAIIYGYQPVEEAFVLGLMHDLGLLVLETYFPSQSQTVWTQVKKGEILTEVEQEIYGTNHARVGQFLLEKWNLPPFMAEVVGKHHHELWQLEDQKNGVLSRIVNLGGRISKFRSYKLSGDDIAEIQKINDFAESLGIGSIDLLRVQARTLSMVEEEAKFLGIETDATVNLLEKANQLIYEQFKQVEEALEKNHLMNKQMELQKIDEAAMETLKTNADTLYHSINTITSTLMGGAQLVRHAISNGHIIDNENIASNYADLVFSSLETIARSQEELRKLSL